MTFPTRSVKNADYEVGYLDSYSGWFVSDVDGWQPGELHDGSAEDTPGACPPTFTWGGRTAWLEIQSIGLKKFYFRGPFERVGILTDETAKYSAFGNVGQSEDGEWIAEGPLVIKCRRIGPAWGLHAHAGIVIGFEGTFKHVNTSLGFGQSGGGSIGCEYGMWDPFAGCPTNGTGGTGSGPGGGGTYRIDICRSYYEDGAFVVECYHYYV